MKNNLIIIFSIIFVIIFSVGYGTAYSQSEEIPKWVKNTALLWGQGEIGDEEFFGLIEFLLEKEIITVSNNQEDDNPMTVEERQSQLTSQYYLQLDSLLKQEEEILLEFGLLDPELEKKIDSLEDEYYDISGQILDEEKGESSRTAKQLDSLYEQIDTIDSEYDRIESELIKSQKEELDKRLDLIAAQRDKVNTEYEAECLTCTNITDEEYSQLDSLYEQIDTIRLEFGLLDPELEKKIDSLEKKIELLNDEYYEMEDDQWRSYWRASEYIELLHQTDPLKVQLIEMQNKSSSEYYLSWSELTSAQQRELDKRLAPVETQIDEIWGDDMSLQYNDDYFLVVEYGNGMVISIDRYEYVFGDTIKLSGKLKPDDLLVKSMSVVVRVIGESHELYKIASCPDYVYDADLGYSVYC